MLTGEQIKDRKIVSGHDDSAQRGVSYDLRIGKILTSDGKCHTSFVIKPQGIVEVVSEERLVLPGDLAGTAMVKTGLSDRGILALNIGIIDPLYEGKISSYLVNFGRTPQSLKVGEPFLRTSFYKLESESKFSKSVKMNDSDYETGAQRKIVSLFSDTFLNTEQVIQDFLKESMDKYRTQILSYVSLAALTLAVLTLFLNFGNIYLVHRWIDPQESLKNAAQRNIDGYHAQVEAENQSLKARLKALEDDRTRLKP